MEFMPSLSAFLLKNGVICTVKKYKMIEKIVDAEDVGLCWRRPLGIVSTPKDLEPYIKDSGFKTVEDWWEKIREFVPNKKDTLYLYKVEILRR